MVTNRLAVLLSAALLVLAVFTGVALAAKLSGKIAIDGSSTVFPITEAVAEEFQAANPGVKVTVGISGTGGGFKKFGAGETAISDASRPIKSGEADTCRAAGISYIELPIAFDGLSVVVNKQNTWVDKLTVAELKAIWSPESKINNWSQVRSGFPNVALKLYGPGTDSGTFDYFTEAIVGTAKSSRSDFTASEDDNVLVQGVAGEKGGLGYFGYAYYVENTDKLKIVPIDNGNGKAVTPSDQTISNGTYNPLSRPLFIYVNGAAADRPEVEAFVDYYLANAAQLAHEVGYTALPASAYDIVTQRFEKRRMGSAFSGKETIGLTIEEVLAAER
jgi:phosphate transport system substrate-binding protein